MAYSTSRGSMWVGDSLNFMKKNIMDEEVDLIITSPPFPSSFKKYTNQATLNEYFNWFMQFVDEFFRILKPTGSLVVDFGGVWAGDKKPVKSLYAFHILIQLCTRKINPFFLAQDFYWFNPNKFPSPAFWVNKERIRVKDSINYVWWFAKTPFPKANNKRVLNTYSPAMLKLIERGSYNTGTRYSGFNVGGNFVKNNKGSIPSNLLVYTNSFDVEYTSACKELGLKIHPARMPKEIPDFFIRLCTTKNDLIFDPFAGSNTTGMVAERKLRNWISVDIDEDFAQSSKLRFDYV